MRILLDTNAYVAFKQGEKNALETLRRVDEIGVSVIVLGELLAGFAVGQREERNKIELAAFLDSSRINIVVVDRNTSRFYAHIYKQLREKGKPIPTNDMWIAATALQHEYVIFTYDKHFFQINGLLTGSRLEDFFPA